MILNIHRKKTPNRGDLSSAPCLYFSDAENIIFADVLDCDGRDSRINKYLCDAEIIVFGGGGLLDHPKFDDSLCYILENYGYKTVIWGAGSNSISNQHFKSRLGSAKYVGIRDFGVSNNYTWVPCASCMSNDFDIVIKDREKLYVGGVGILENNAGKSIAPVNDLGFNARKFGNKKVSTLEILEFIISLDYLVSSSFHACYWATLLGIPVIGVPTSSKFHTFKYKFPLAKKNNWEQFLEKTIVYDGALEDCREANIDFLSKVSTFSKDLAVKDFGDK